VVRDPPRKSEQACRAVRCSRCQRAQPRRPNKSGTACIERRQRDGRRQRHRLRIHSAQRQRQRRVLGHAEPGPRQYESARLWSRSNRCIYENAQLMGHGKTNEQRMQAKKWIRGIEGIGRDCMMEERSRSRKHFDSYLYDNISRRPGVNGGAWYGTVRLECNGHNYWIRYLFFSNLKCWHRSLFAHAWTHTRSCRMQCKVSSKMPFHQACALIMTPHQMPPAFLQSVPPAESRPPAHRKTRRPRQHQSP
jgi:hypothetical protein